MPWVRLTPSKGAPLRIEVPSGTNLLRAVHAAGLPIARACGENRICGRCVVAVRDGASALSPEDSKETSTKTRNRLGGAARLACCAEIRGDVEISASYW